mmetsp:Transcript_8021/g.9100  ORF Transcript_8021/g.9100 Transcript_8021/m.9100 type:complete len:225 (+) Transcript_8021:55-729(+)|eukprot:CAMPEP_0168325918 /NCGR_PEP_ID=MMETSP0213-20121227/4982_1 /TAXON_ID=151035 /ORGANISM="Euplotes harpa, Strain FSP1.4" /LENGTH=224 /DNA_ID=CAMNT_0008328511 /DNA_START=147 /DNA_END=821 /DNA_ORIENTATION=-
MKELERRLEIGPILNDFPTLSSMKFTNFQMNYLHYIVFIHNNSLLLSCLSLKALHKDILDSTDNCGNKLLHTAILCNNKEALGILLDFYKRNYKSSANDETVLKWKNAKGLTCYELAERKENADLISVLHSDSWGANAKLDTECNSMIPDNMLAPQNLSSKSLIKTATKSNDNSIEEENKHVESRTKFRNQKKNDGLLDSIVSSRTKALLNGIEMLSNDEDENE